MAFSPTSLLPPAGGLRQQGGVRAFGPQVWMAGWDLLVKVFVSPTRVSSRREAHLSPSIALVPGD